MRTVCKAFWLRKVWKTQNCRKLNMTIKPFLLIFFDNSEKACFAILFFDLPSLWQDFSLFYVQHNEDYVVTK